MWLETVQARDFKCFAAVHWNLSSSGQILVYGANNAGKSALVSLLDVVQGASYPAMLRSDGHKMQVVATFRLSHEDRTAGVHGRLDDDFLERGGLETIRFTFEEHENRTYLSSLEVQLRDETFATAAWTERQDAYSWRTCGLPTNTQLRSWDGAEVQEYASGHQGPSDLRNVNEIQPLLGLLEKWRRGVFHFRSGKTAPSRGVSMSADLSLAPDGSNLAQVLVGLQLNRPDLMASVREQIQILVPGVGLAMTPATASQADITFQVPGSEFQVNLDSTGSGVTQILMLLVLGATRQEPSILILEEPETGLHPAAQRAMSELLAEWAETHPVVVTTHSPALLGNAAHCQTLLVERADGLSSVRVIESEWMDVAQALGAQLLDALVAERILVVEGKSDLSVLNVWFPSMTRDPRIAIIEAGGGNGARGAVTFSRWLNQADKLQHRRVVFLRDRDELPDSEIRQLEKLSVVSILSVREIENYLLDETAICSYLATQGARDISPDRVLELLKAAADSLLDSVVLRTVAREQAPIRLMDDATRRALVRAGSGANELSEAVMARVPLRRPLKTRINQRWREVQRDLTHRWPDEWRRLAPGADVLDACFKEVLGRRFNKVSDGPALAQLVPPPDELKRIFAPLI